MFTRKEEIKSHVPARVRAYGRARIEIAQKAQTSQEWNELWKPPIQPFAFEWGKHWKQCIEYKVKDFTAEVGFFIDLLGLPVNAFNENYAMFTSPDQEFYFAVVEAANGKSTPVDALRIQFMVADLFKTSEELQKRGIQFSEEPQPVSPGSDQWVASFQTPNGICMEIWGYVEKRAPDSEQPAEAEMEEEIRPSANNEQKESGKPETSDFRKGQQAVVQQVGVDEVDDEEDEFDWSIPDDLEEETEEDEESGTDLEAMESFEFEEDEAEPTPLESYSTDKKSEKPAPVQSFQSAEEMLEHLRQKQNQRNAGSRRPGQPESTSANKPKPEQPPERSKMSFSPAPKRNGNQKTDSVWDRVNLDEEYVALDEPAGEEYHYQPIPLKRKE